MHVFPPRRDDRQLPVKGVVVEQRGIHQTAVPVARQPVPGVVPRARTVHGRFHRHQRAVPERFHARAKGVSGAHGFSQRLEFQKVRGGDKTRLIVYYYYYYSYNTSYTIRHDIFKIENIHDIQVRGW